jgi:hypothetical protein
VPWLGSRSQERRKAEAHCLENCALQLAESERACAKWDLVRAHARARERERERDRGRA